MVLGCAVPELGEGSAQASSPMTYPKEPPGRASTTASKGSKGTRLVRVRIALDSKPSRAPVAPPGRPAGPPTHPYHPTGRPYVGVYPIPDLTTTQRTKFHTRTQFDATGKTHAHNLSNSGLNRVSMQSMPPP